MQTESRGGLAVASDKGVTVAVDTELTLELIEEGYARDLVRTINNMRKDAGLDIADRIDLAFEAGSDVTSAISNFADYIVQETLTVDLHAGSLENALYVETVAIGDEEVMLALRKTQEN